MLAATPIVDSIKKKLTAGQRDAARAIEITMRRAGVPEVVIKGAIVNAYRESKLNPAAVGDNGHSWGLFQANYKGAAAGVSHASVVLLEPVNATRNILHRALFTPYGAPVLRAKDAVEAAELWTRRVERPADPDGQAAISRKLAADWWSDADGTV